MIPLGRCVAIALLRRLRAVSQIPVGVQAQLKVEYGPGVRGEYPRLARQLNIMTDEKAGVSALPATHWQHRPPSALTMDMTLQASGELRMVALSPCDERESRCTSCHVASTGFTEK